MAAPERLTGLERAATVEHAREEERRAARLATAEARAAAATADGTAPATSGGAVVVSPRAGLLRGRRRGGPRRAPWLLAIPAIAVLLAFHFVAQAEGAWYSFTDWTGVGDATWVGLDNFRHIWHSEIQRGALWNSLKLAVAFVVIVNVIGLTLALGLNRSVKSRHVLRSLFFLPVVLSALASAYIWQYIFDYRGALNQLLGAVGLESWQRPWLGDPDWAFWAILVTMVWQFAGLAMVIYLAGLQGISQELDEAAAVDGASPWFRFRRVTLPLLAPAITTSATLTLIFGLKVFDQILALTGGGPDYATETLATQVYTQTFANGLFGYGSALALVLTVLVMILAAAQLVILRGREARI